MVDSLFSKQPRQVYGTGMWPWYYPRPWNFNPPPGVGAIIDPVAIAQETAFELKKVGWPGIGLMDQEFQLRLLELPETDVEATVQTWFEERRNDVATLLQTRLPTYRAERLSRTAATAMHDAIAHYRNGAFLSSVRVLMPEFESIGRNLVTDQVTRT